MSAEDYGYKVIDKWMQSRSDDNYIFLDKSSGEIIVMKYLIRESPTTVQKIVRDCIGIYNREMRIPKILSRLEKKRAIVLW